MLRVISISLLLFLFFIKSFAYPNEYIVLSSKAKVSIITCSPGQELYSIFGHTALRINDPVKQIDKVYNYGTFNFDTPNFYLKFAKGDLQYYLSVAPFKNFFYAYQQENRSLEEQVLNLSHDEKQKVYYLLQQGLKPENKYYRYQFFEDNCTTRIYELLVEALNRNMIIDTFYIGEINEKESFRELFSSYVDKLPWVKLGMNLGLGIQTDKKASFTERMFLPLEFESALDHSYNNEEPLVLVKRQLLTNDSIKEKEENISSFFSSPLLLLSLLVLIIIFISLKLKNSTKSHYLDIIVFGATGLLGLVFLYLWLFSLHTPTHKNLNLLWLSPLNFLLLVKSRKIRGVKKFYIIFYLSILILLIFINAIYNFYVVEFYPLVIIIITRLFFIYRKGLSFEQEQALKRICKLGKRGRSDNKKLSFK